METRKLGQSDIEITVIAFGAWAIGGWMWGGADKKDAIKAIDTAIDNGMTTIDTASIYGFGLSEELVGKAIHGKRDKVQLLTKFGMAWGNAEGYFYFSTKDNDGKDIDIYKNSTKKKIIQDCEDSLRRLKTDYIDLFQIHWPDPLTTVSETMETLNRLIETGKIRAAGVCNYSVDLLIEAEKTINLASNQMPYSMVKRDIENDIVPYCTGKNMGILAYSPIQRGLLSGKIKPGHKFNAGDTRPDSPYFKEPNLTRILEFLEHLKPIAENHNATLSQLVLNWTIQQPGITCALAGARNASQVIENAGASDFSLEKNEIMTINGYISNLQVDKNI